MLHLRIVVPSYQAEHTLDLLDNTPSICNLIGLDRQAKRPQGDAILCDVTGEDASVIIADLRELDIDTEGSIAIEEIDSEISVAATKAEKSARGRALQPVVWEELNPRTSESTELSASFLIFMSLATMIAACGIFLNSPILIVGAMVIGPEFGPLAGLCVATVQRRSESVVAIAAGPRDRLSGRDHGRLPRRLGVQGDGRYPIRLQPHQPQPVGRDLEPRLLLVLRRLLCRHRRHPLADHVRNRASWSAC